MKTKYIKLFSGTWLFFFMFGLGLYKRGQHIAAYLSFTLGAVSFILFFVELYKNSGKRINPKDKNAVLLREKEEAEKKEKNKPWRTKTMMLLQLVVGIAILRYSKSNPSDFEMSFYGLVAGLALVTSIFQLLQKSESRKKNPQGIN